MTTLYNFQAKRQVGNETTLMDDTVAIFDSTTVAFGGASPATTWTFINKTS